MNFDLSEEQQVVVDLAAQLFGDLATTERVKTVESEGGFDADLWAALADAGLLGLCLPEECGGSGMGMVELALIAHQQGRTVAPVPVVASVVAAMTIAEHLGAEPTARSALDAMIAGDTVLTTAIAEVGVNDPLNPNVVASSTPDGYRLSGEKPTVVALPVAGFVLVPASHEGSVIVAMVDTAADGVAIEALSTTNHESQGHLTLEAVDVPATLVITEARALDDLFLRTLTGLSAIQLGVGEGSVAHAAEHVSTRQQFGRPLSAFQAVSQRAADGYIVNDALRSTVLSAAWRLDHRDEGIDAVPDVLTVAYWASEGTQQVVLGAQHLHGGIGADVDHPVHRHFLWGMQLASSLGTASSHLERLGRHLAASPADR